MRRDSEIIVFKLLDLDGDKILNVVDLMQLCAHFKPGMTLGNNIHILMQKYQAENLKPGYGHSNF
jgi:hypothetical protein